MDSDLAVLLSILVGIWIGIMLVLHIKGFFKSLKTSTFTKPATSLSAASPSKPVTNDLLSVTRTCIIAALIILAGCMTVLLIILALAVIF